MAVISLHRPGPMARDIDDYVARKNGGRQPQLHRDEAVLKDTHG